MNTPDCVGVCNSRPACSHEAARPQTKSPHRGHPFREAHSSGKTRDLAERLGATVWEVLAGAVAASLMAKISFHRLC